MQAIIIKYIKLYQKEIHKNKIIIMCKYDINENIREKNITTSNHMQV